MPITRAALRKNIEGYVGKALGSLLVYLILKKNIIGFPRNTFNQILRVDSIILLRIFSPGYVRLAFSILVLQFCNHSITTSLASHLTTKTHITT